MSARPGWTLVVRDQSHLLAARRVVRAGVAVVHARHNDGALVREIHAERHARLPQPATRKRVRLAATATSVTATATAASTAASTTTTTATA